MLLAACGGDAALLKEMCQHFQAQIPEQLAAIRNALRDSDAPSLRELAHKCCSRLATFSAVVGDLAGQLEDLAIGAELDKAPPILQQLETGVSELLIQVEGLSIEQLQDQTGVPRDGNGTGRP
jgi:HPt (histidine-containing phosphotransfer) domain-containing protein